MCFGSKGHTDRQPQDMPGSSNPAPQLATDGRTNQGQDRYLPLVLPAAEAGLDLGFGLGFLPSLLLGGAAAADALS